LHSTVSANWPITIGLMTGRKPNGAVWDRQRTQERALWRALRFDAGPAPRM
jgi:hypothetical protein